MKCAIFEENSPSCVVYFRFSGTIFPVSMIEGDLTFTSVSKNCSGANSEVAERRDPDNFLRFPPQEWCAWTMPEIAFKETTQGGTKFFSISRLGPSINCSPPKTSGIPSTKKNI